MPETVHQHVLLAKNVVLVAAERQRGADHEFVLCRTVHLAVLQFDRLAVSFLWFRAIDRQRRTEFAVHSTVGEQLFIQTSTPVVDSFAALVAFFVRLHV